MRMSICSPPYIEMKERWDMLHILLFVIFIVLFIVGMTFLRTGLYNASAQNLQSWLVKLTDTPLKGFIAGILVTAILQSSSAVMVITIGLIAAKILSFPQSIGIILGTNIGTTFTTEFITFNIDTLLIPMAVIGAICIICNPLPIKSIGFIFLGLSSIFTAMNGFETSAEPLASLSLLKDSFDVLNSSHLISIFAGTILTAIIQSSTAATGIVMGFLSTHILDLDTGIAIVLGANIGTCMTAYIASIGSGREAKLCAYAHIWLNVLGVILFLPFINQLTVFAGYLSSYPDMQLAHSSVLFNCLSSIIILPFAKKFGVFIEKTHGGI